MASAPTFRTALALALLLAPVAATALELSVPAAPVATRVEGRTVLGYELYLDNPGATALEPLDVEVLDGTRRLARFEGAALEARLDRSGRQADPAATGPIAGHGRAIVFIDLALEGERPRALSHRVRYRPAGSDLPEAGAEGARVEPLADSAAVLSPPLAGGPWVAVSDTRWLRGHRRVAYAVDGQPRTPGRYAVDWLKVDGTGHAQRRDGRLASDAYGHGERVLAVADAVVAKVRDDVGERRSLDDRHDATRARREGSGNAVVLDLGDGRFVHYAHLRPGSIAVHAGQRVRRGEPLAEVGFSGSAGRPQLHFAVTGGAEEAASEGLPFRLDAFDLLGAYADAGMAGEQVWGPASVDPGPRKDEMPRRGAVVWFAPAGGKRRGR